MRSITNTNFVSSLTPAPISKYLFTCGARARVEGERRVFKVSGEQHKAASSDYFDRATTAQLSGTGRDVRLEFWDLRVLDLVEATCFASKELKAWKAVEELDHDRLAKTVLIRRSVRHAKPTLGGGGGGREYASECVK
jgi:hypothetical protein